MDAGVSFSPLQINPEDLKWEVGAACVDSLVFTHQNLKPLANHQKWVCPHQPSYKDVVLISLMIEDVLSLPGLWWGETLAVTMKVLRCFGVWRHSVWIKGMINCYCAIKTVQESSVGLTRWEILSSFWLVGFPPAWGRQVSQTLSALAAVAALTDVAKGLQGLPNDIFTPC